ncbi:MAG: response regulator [Candidatus Eremiobacteraeota bacterium]|nr:response regulator [Candidatus Eremiobacteraeota bacterium]
MTQAGDILVLVVEDDERLRRVIVSALEDEEGLVILSAGSGDQALQLAKEQPFELVITDIKMPGVDGLEALRRMKVQRPELESIVITGYSTEEESIRAVRLRVGEYLRKPFRLDDLLDAVARAVGRIRDARSLHFREQSMLETTLWAIEAMVAALPNQEESGLGCLERGRLAGRVAEALGYDRTTAQNVQVATLVAALERAQVGPVAAFRQGLPSSIKSILEGGEAHDQKLASEVLEAALAYPEVEGRVGRLMRELAKHNSQAEGREELLAAAYLCEVSGDREAAVSAYEELLSKEPRPHRRVEALLGSARLHAAGGQLGPSQESVAKAVEVAGDLPTDVKAHVFLEGGLILARIGSDRAFGLLEQSLQEALTGSGDQARAQLALTFLGRGRQEWIEPALNQLLSAAHLDVLLDSAWWLLPGLLRHNQATPSVTRSLRRLVKELPGQVFALIDSTPLSEEAQLNLVKTLSEARPRGLESLSRQLSKKTTFASVRQALEKAEADGVEAGAPSLLRIFSMGGFEVFRGEERLDSKVMGGKKRYYVLAYVAAADRPLSEDELMEQFWPDLGANSRKRLSQAISVLRRGLRPDSDDSDVNYILKSSAGFSLNPEVPYWHDYQELTRVLDNVEHLDGSQPWAKVGAYLEQMTRLYRGPYLSGCYLDWALLQRSQLEQRMTACLLKLSGIASEQQMFQQALYCSERVLEFDSCNQEAALRAMEACLELGRPEGALKLFQLCQKSLKRELDLEPSIDLLRAQQKALLMG